MNQNIFTKVASVVVLFTVILLNTVNVLASNNRFPLPTTKTYYVTVLSKYSSGAKHDTYIYTYGPLKNNSEDCNIVMDIAANANTPIYAVADGVVRTNRYGSGGGYYLVISHNDGTYSYYGHLIRQSSYFVGSNVKAGDIIGYVGKTGAATGYHLHFEWSGHDPYCEYSSLGYVTINPNSGASIYPHTHNSQSSSSPYIVETPPEASVVTPVPETSNTYTAYVVNTDGSLAINSKPSSGNMIGSIPEGGAVTVYPDKNLGNWYWVNYNGVSGYSYGKYLTTSAKPSTPDSNTCTGVIKGTDGSLAINSVPKSGNMIGSIPEGASVTVYPSKTSGNWYWVSYNGINGYSYKTYIILQ